MDYMATVESIMSTRATFTEEMARRFLDVTGLKITECALVEKQDGTEVRWWFESKPVIQPAVPAAKEILSNVIRVQDERRRLNHRASSVIDFVDGINETARAYGLSDAEVADLWWPK